MWGWIYHTGRRTVAVVNMYVECRVAASSTASVVGETLCLAGIEGPRYEGTDDIGVLTVREQVNGILRDDEVGYSTAHVRYNAVQWERNRPTVDTVIPSWIQW